jgi:23S rRNA pseudouridine1911/1915/1917 synthase
MLKTVTIAHTFHAQRIDVVLASLFPEYSRTHLSQFIKSGHILLDNTPVKPNTKVKFNQLITIHADFKLTEHPGFDNIVPNSCNYSVVYDDEAILVINKPAGLTVHPGVGTENNTLANGLINDYPTLVTLPRCGIVHRLDKDTTGLMVIAKTLEAQTALTRMIQAREIKREYIALVHGMVECAGTIRTFFGRHPKNRLKMSVLKAGKLAVTHYQPIRQYDFLSLVHLQLETGRTHQIRVHLSHIHHPIIGDPLYGRPIHFPNNTPVHFIDQLKQFKRQALHAKLLSFLHPITHSPLTFEAEIPHDLASLIFFAQDN